MSVGEFAMALNMVGALPYMWLILRGQVRPSRITWFVWTVILTIAVAGYGASGAGDSIWFLVGDLVVTAAIFGLSLWYGQSGWSRLDGWCLAIAAGSLALWLASSAPLTGLLGVLLADAVACVPTIVKALRDPRSESSITFAFSSVSALCGLVAVGAWDPMLLFYPAYLFIANFVVTLVVWVGKYQVARLASGVRSD